MTCQKTLSTGSAELNSPRRITLACLIICLFVVLGLGRAAASITQSAQQQSGANKAADEEKDVRLLEMGMPIERELAGGQSHLYQITLAAGQYLNVVVDQRGVDVVVTLLGPDGKKLIEVDSPNGTQGPEPVSWIVETAGIYRLEVRSLEKDAKPGRYEAKVVELRAATDRDRDLAEAGKLYSESVSLRGKGQYGQAIPLAERALTLREKTLSAEHPDTATSLNNLAELYRAKGDYTHAEPLYRRALTIREKTLGAGHPTTATSLNNLASLYHKKGDYAQAEPLYRRALTIREKTLGAEHPTTAASLNNLARLYEATGDISQAVALRSRAQAIEERNLSVNLATGSERQKLAYLVTLAGSSNQSVDLHVRSAPDNSTARDLALTAILQRKGRVLDAMNDGVESLRLRANPQDRALFDQLKGERARLALLVFGWPQNASPAEYQLAIKRLEESVEKLEGQIGDRSSKFRAQSQPVTLAAVQAAIPADAALVEFFAYRPFNPKSTNRDERLGQPRYVAYVLRRQGEARWVELDESKAIDEAVGELRKALHNPKSADVKRLARRVDKLVMQPVQSLLGKAHRVFISPDGALNLVPFAALVDEQNRYLVERYSFTYLTSGRDLLRFRPAAQIAKAPVIVADPDFGEKSVDSKAASSAGILDLTQAYFSPLTATAQEAKALKAILPQATVLTKDQATETALKQVANPSVLHIATHGFFLADKPEDAAETERQRKLLQQTGDWSSLVGRLENPLLRSGLGLAGANQRKSGDDDGILTAMEVAGLNHLPGGRPEEAKTRKRQSPQILRPRSHLLSKN